MEREKETTETYPEQVVETEYHVLETAADLAGLPAVLSNWHGRG